MRELERPIGRVWRRLRFQRFLAALVWCWSAALALVAVSLAVEKLTQRSLPGPDWAPFALAVGVGMLVAALIAAVGGPSRMDAAVAIDRVYHLDERLSTALTLPADLRASPAGRALMNDVIRHLEDLDVRPAFGPKLPKLAWLPLLPAALAVGLLFVELSRSPAQARSATGAEKLLVKAQSKALGKKIASQRKEIEKTRFPEADRLLAQIEKAADDLAKAPPAQKDKALVALNTLSDALKDRQKQLGSPDQINRQLQNLKDAASQGPADKFARELARGDFLKAADELKALQEKLTSGKMTQAEKKALKEQLEAMSKQLQKLANLEERKRQLQEARNNGGLTQPQFEREMAKLDEQAKSLQQLQKLASKLGEAGKQMDQGDPRKAAEALGMTREQVAEMARNLQELEALDGAMADLQDAKNGLAGDGMNQLGEGLPRFGDLGGNRRDARNGQNGLGRGRGEGDRPEAPDNTSSYSTQVKQQLVKGKAVATGTAPPNAPIKGHSVLEVQGEIATSSGNSADALSNQKVPRNIEKHIRGYFDQINKGQ